MADEVRADPQLLRAKAQSCLDLHGSLRSSLSDVEPETVAADRGLSGWQTQAALQQLLWWHRDDVAKLGTELQDMADALGRCAADYEHTDQASADHFTDVRL